MSLTSYRAAPPRVELFVCVRRHKTALLLFWHGGGFWFVFRGPIQISLTLRHRDAMFDRLEDLAATYSPVP